MKSLLSSRSAALVLLFLAALACGPRAAATPDAFATSAAATVAAQLSQVAVVSPTDTPTSTPVPPTSTPAPTATPTEAPCTNNSAFVADVTIPDDTSMTPGQSFDKTWRLRNTGTCTWTIEYDVVFVDGNIMGGPASKPLVGSVAPGSTVDVTLGLTAPATNGTFRGNWRLRNDGGVLFGVTFYVQIIVGPTPTPAPQVHKADTITVNSSFHFDLDAGDPAAPATTKDGWYRAVSAVEQYLTPENGALFKKWGSGVPTFEDCKSAALSGAEISLADLPVGTWVCYRTNEGRYGRFEVEGKTTTTWTIDFRTWK
jgi:hypothetical protein